MSVILAVRSAPGQLAEVPPPLRLENGEIIVGRGVGSHILLAGQTVSRRHCTISGDGQNWHVFDSSTGGTFVNGQRIAGPQFLRHGDMIRVGDCEIAVMLDRAGQAGAADQAAPGDEWRRFGGPSQAPQDQSNAWAPLGGGQDAVALLLQAAGLSRRSLSAADYQVAATAGAILRSAIGGLLRLAQDRRKAREELGAISEPAELLDVAISEQELLLQLLSGTPTDAAGRVDALYTEIDRHQRAVLGSMQISLHRALDQFSPAAIKTNARGDADAWKIYERAFDAREDGFVESFAQAFSKQYAQTES